MVVSCFTHIVDMVTGRQLLSMVTPRLFVERANVIEASFNFISGIADSWRSLACVPIKLASDLSGFN